MKKIVLYILVTIVINYCFGLVSLTATADGPTTTAAGTTATSGTATQADSRTYSPSIIPKPKTLPGPSAEEQNLGGTANLSTGKILTEILLPKATTAMIGFVGVTSFLMLIVAGVRFIVAYGNTEAVQKAQTEIIYAIIGLIVALLAYTIVNIVTNIKIEGLDPTTTTTTPAQTNAQSSS
ncbi:MAG: hypothetical protein WC285_00800 [Candidatus Gracilibacteria bacterium]|jgi:uncharacterized protein YceK